MGEIVMEHITVAMHRLIKKLQQGWEKNMTKQQYEELLAKIKRGETYLDNNDIPFEERERWIGKYQELVHELNKYYDEYKQDRLLNIKYEEVK